MPRILIVEDDTDINNAICEYLTQKAAPVPRRFPAPKADCIGSRVGWTLSWLTLCCPESRASS